MQSSIQQLKAYGHLPQIGLKNLADNRAASFAAQVDSDVLAGRCCGTPDLGDEEIAETDPAIVGQALGMELEEATILGRTHRTLLEATGRGSWPAGCHKDLYPHDDRHCVTYHVRRSTFNNNWLRASGEDELRHVAGSGVWDNILTGFVGNDGGIAVKGRKAEAMLDLWLGKPILDVGLWLMHESMRRIGVHLIQMESETNHDILLLCRNIPGSTIGIGWFNNGTCRDVVESHYDASWRPSVARASLLLNHEVGHNLNLQHEFNGQSRHQSVMSYNWPNNTYGFLTGDEGILPRDASWPTLIRFFGGEEIPRDDQPPTDPTDPNVPQRLDGKFYADLIPSRRPAIRGSLTLRKGTTIKEDTKYIMWPVEGTDEYELRLPPNV